MIVWVDEDERNTFPTQLLLRKRDYTLDLVSNATDGYNAIVEATRRDLDLAIVDVMLLQGADLERFSDQETRSGVLTGLVLSKLLLQDIPDYPWKQKLIIYSRASDPDIVREIANFATKRGLAYFQKSSEMKSSVFVAMLRQQGFITR